MFVQVNDILMFNDFFLKLQLGPWLAVEIPDMIEKGIVTYKENVQG